MTQLTENPRYLPGAHRVKVAGPHPVEVLNGAQTAGDPGGRSYGNFGSVTSTISVGQTADVNSVWIRRGTPAFSLAASFVNNESSGGTKGWTTPDGATSVIISQQAPDGTYHKV